MDIKWFAIMVVGGALAMMIGMSVENYMKNDCAKSYAATSRSADEIAKICGLSSVRIGGK